MSRSSSRIDSTYDVPGLDAALAALSSGDAALESSISGLESSVSGLASADSGLAERIAVLEASYWEDLHFPATAINPAGAPSPMTFDATNFGFTASASGTTCLAIIGQMPHSWKIGSSIYPHIHWEPITTHGGDVLWRLEYAWVNIGGTEPQSLTPVDVLQAGGGVALKHQLASFPAISGAGKTLSSIISMKISRIGGDQTDTYTGDALLKEFDIHYESDSLGSRTELAK